MKQCLLTAFTATILSGCALHIGPKVEKQEKLNKIDTTQIFAASSGVEECENTMQGYQKMTTLKDVKGTGANEQEANENAITNAHTLAKQMGYKDYLLLIERKLAYTKSPSGRRDYSCSGNGLAYAEITFNVVIKTNN